MSHWRIAVAAAAVAVPTVPTALAEQSAEELAKSLANPLASLVSLPVQVNLDRGLGPGADGTRLLTNVQPVVPFAVSEEWNVISRTVLPVIWQDDVVPATGGQFGLGDTVQSLFLSPAAATASGIVWGIGPVFLLPTATDDRLGSGKWGLGPTGVVLRQSGPWTYGLLGNHIWSLAGDDDRRDVNATYLQPFVNYTFPSATTLFAGAEVTYDWDRAEASPKLVAGVNQMLRLGPQLVQVGAGLSYWPESPANGPEGFGARLNFVLLFPK